jgi:hypothetical protein
MKLPESINIIAHYLDRSDMIKPRLAVELWKTKNDYYWPETKYSTWRKFCSDEVALSQSSIYRYLNTVTLMNKFDYDLIQVLNIVKVIGWSRFQLGITKITAKLTVNKFISTYKDLNLNERVKFEANYSKLVHFTFAIPEQDAETLTNELIIRGMRVHKHNRINASAAMVALIKEMYKD